MTNDTRNRIESYKQALSGMKERVFAALVMLMIAVTTAVTATYAWVTLSRAPEVSGIATTVAANGNLEIALSDDDGEEPDEYDVDEGIQKTVDIVSSNLQWGNLVNLSDPFYGIDNLALRPAQLNTANLLVNPLWGAAYGEDGRITNMDSNYAYAKYDGTQFMTSTEYGVRAIASYTQVISDATQQAYKEKLDDVVQAHQAVNTAYSAVPGKFAALGTMISKYAQDKLDDNANPGSNLAPYLKDVLPLYEALYDAMLKQEDALVALANFQNYLYTQNTGGTFTELTWEDLVNGKSQYNAASVDSSSTNGVISIVGLSQFITDLGTMEKDIEHLTAYTANYDSAGTPYYWSSGGDSGYQINNMVAHLVDYGSMTIDLNDDGTETVVVGLSSSDAGALLTANGKNRKVYVYNGIMKRFEQSAVDESYRLNGNAACTIKVSYVLTITVYGKAYTKASGPCWFMDNFQKASGGNLVASDQVAQDTYGMAVDLWVRTNAEETCLTLEGATAVDENGTIIQYDGVNRIWGSTNKTVLTTDSTTQGGGSCYIYYADTPEDQARSLDLLDSMKVAFVSSDGKLLATAGMDTVNYCAVNGRVTVPLVLDTDTETTYTYTNALNETLTGRAITRLLMDTPVRITALIYLDGTLLTNDQVLASSEIQGQLNLQFGSSERLDTAGSNDLIDDTRSVTASVDRTSMDYDNASTAEDLTAHVTLQMQGTVPTEVSAFFVRAINSTQGSREATMTFAKQDDGTWTADYVFNAPGTYYLRNVRLDGVDYTLSEPIMIEVSGFSLKSVTWSEASSSATVRTSANTYQEKVTVEFATNDATKMPSSVNARFIRADGNTVNIPLKKGTDGKWSGTGTFSTSGVYTLEYLTYKTNEGSSEKYKDLVAGGYAKTLDLALGMYVKVQDLTGSLVQNYEEGQTYSKDIAVTIYDNAGNELTGLTGARLYYSNGGSASNTINTDLTWNELDAWYEGTLPIVAAGRYQFAYVNLDGQLLTKASESPTYTVISPDPPIYRENSESTYHNDTQFVPLTNDAVIDKIGIDNSASATVSAVVYNSESGAYYTVDSTKVTYSGNTWTIALPAYTLDLEADGSAKPDAEYTQDGTWSVAALKLTDCYDADSVFRDTDNPIIWVGNDEIGQRYVEEFLTDEDGSTSSYEEKDFSKLSTTVSCSVKVVMNAGTTKLGSTSTDFMTQFPVNGIGMNVLLTDNAGRVIPAKKVTDVTLKVNYIPPTETDSYGYKVQSGAARSYTIQLNTQNAESGIRTVSSSDIWQYVGQYQVESLTVTIGGNTLTFPAGDTIGVPTEYTITTMGPAAENISIENVKQTKTEFGKDGSNVIGTFLESYDLKSTNVEISLTPKDVNITQYAVMENVSATLNLTYQGGSDTNGGYTFTRGTSPYENLTLNMSRADGSKSYTAGTSVLLAGTYKAKIQVTVDGAVSELSLNDVTVYSKQPDVTMALADGTPSTVTVNKDAGTAASSNTFTANNTIVNDGHSAVLFASYRPFEADENPGTYSSYSENGLHADEFAHYEMPSLTFSLNGVGNTCKDFRMETANNSAGVDFGGDGSTVKVQIGSITEGTEPRRGTYTYTNWIGSVQTGECDYTYITQTPIVIGSQEVIAITATEQGTVYTLNLAHPLSIVQENETPPRVTFVIDNSDFVTPESVTSEDGRDFVYTLPSALYTSSGDTSVIEKIEKISNDTETTGINPDEEVNTKAITDDLNWQDSSSEVKSRLVYTVSSEVKQDTHTVKSNWGLITFSATYYWKELTSKIYKETSLAQYAETVMSVTGTTVDTKITQTFNVTTQLDYWMLDGIRYQPGETVTITGNSIVTPVYSTNEALLQKVVETKTTIGETDYKYRAECSAIKTEFVQNGNTTTGIKYCEHNGNLKNCTMKKGNYNTALADSVDEPTNEGATKVSSAAEGIVRNFTSSKWARYGDPVVKSGTTSTNIKVYDGDGNLLSERNE